MAKRERLKLRGEMADGIADDEATPAIVSPKTQRLALAYYIDRLIDEGILVSYAQAAQRLGVTRARMTQILNLTLATIPDQERLLISDLSN